MSEQSGPTGEDEDSGAVASGAVAKGFSLSVSGLLISLVAIGLATVPGIAFDRPLANPFERVQPDPPEVEPPAEREGGVTFRFKNLSVNFGGKPPAEEADPIAKEDPAPELTKDPIKWFTISAIGCAMVGLIVSSVAHVRERHTVFTLGSMGCCAAAITWQYLAIGIAVGVAAAVFLILLSALGGVGG